MESTDWWCEVEEKEQKALEELVGQCCEGGGTGREANGADRSIRLLDPFPISRGPPIKFIQVDQLVNQEHDKSVGQGPLSATKVDSDLRTIYEKIQNQLSAPRLPLSLMSSDNNDNPFRKKMLNHDHHGVYLSPTHSGGKFTPSTTIEEFDDDDLDARSISTWHTSGSQHEVGGSSHHSQQSLSQLVQVLWTRQQEQLSFQERQQAALYAEIEDLQKAKSRLEVLNRTLQEEVNRAKAEKEGQVCQEVQSQQRLLEQEFSNIHGEPFSVVAPYDSPVLPCSRKPNQLLLGRFLESEVAIPEGKSAYLFSRSNSFAEEDISNGEIPEQIANLDPSNQSGSQTDDSLWEKAKDLENKFLRAESRLKKRIRAYEDLQLEVTDLRTELATARTLMEDMVQAQAFDKANVQEPNETCGSEGEQEIVKVGKQEGSLEQQSAVGRIRSLMTNWLANQSTS